MTDDDAEYARREREEVLKSLDRARRRLDEAFERASAELDESWVGRRSQEEFDAALKTTKATLAEAKKDMYARLDALHAEIEAQSGGTTG